MTRGTDPAATLPSGLILGLEQPSALAHETVGSPTYPQIEEAVMDPTRKRNCPECGGRLIWVVYGYPDGEVAEAARRGDVDLGGCCVPAPEQPWRAARCSDCRWSLMGEQDFDSRT